MSNLTRRQHFVSIVYQKGWTNQRWADDTNDGQLWAFNLQERRSFPTGPTAILVANYYYEKNPSTPDNELERKFQNYEGDYGKAVKLLDGALSIAKRKAIEAGVDLDLLVKGIFDRILTNDAECLARLKRFAASAYSRVPGAHAQKKGEMSAHSTGMRLLNTVNTTYDFVTMAHASTLEDRFMSLKAQLWVWTSGEIMTSDRPCVDIAVNGDFFPLFGFDIGRCDDVIAFMPISAQMALVLAPSTIPGFETKDGRAFAGTRVLQAEAAAVVNCFIINMAHRWVLAHERIDGVFALRTRPLDHQTDHIPPTPNSKEE